MSRKSPNLNAFSSYESIEDSAQALELYQQASSLVPSDPTILSKLGEIYDSEGDKSQAFQYYYEVMKFSNLKSTFAELQILSTKYRRNQMVGKLLCRCSIFGKSCSLF